MGLQFLRPQLPTAGETEVKKLKCKQVIKEVEPTEGEFVSIIVLRPKEGGSDSQFKAFEKIH